VKVLADESVDYPVVDALRQKGIDVKYIAEFKSGVTDEIVLENAIRESRILLTADKDFGELVYRLGMLHSGVVLYRLTGLENKQKVKIIVSVFDDHLTELEDKFTVINQTHIRIRKIQ
jgi:predicted nuclease of predicted toxin-antitoxin system